MVGKQPDFREQKLARYNGASGQEAVGDFLSANHLFYLPSSWA